MIKKIFKKIINLDTELKVNFLGYIYIGFTLLIGIAAVNTGNNILYILLSFLLSLMGISSFVALYNLRGLKFRFIPSSEVWCCKENPFRVVIFNKKKLPSFLLKFIFPSKEELFSPFITRITQGKVFIKPNKRGIYKIDEVIVESDFPFGLFTRRKILRPNIEILVFPQPKEIKIPHGLKNSKTFREDKEPTWGNNFLKKSLIGDTVESIKEYHNEPLNLIHWKAYAKSKRLYAKDLTGEELLHSIIIDLEKIPAADWEERISYATYLILYYLKKGFAVGLKYKEYYFEPKRDSKHKKKLLTFLAKI